MLKRNGLILFGLVCSGIVVGLIWMWQQQPDPTPVIDNTQIADAGFFLASRHTGAGRDSRSGNGTFEDVTIAAGMGEPITTESAAWGDYDNDGLVDLFVCGEYVPPSGSSGSAPEPRNRCRLYHNEGNGKFVDVAASAGVENDLCAKGSAWGDYDGDGELEVSWPTSRTTQTFRDILADQAIEITEGVDAIKRLEQPPLPAVPVGKAE